MSTIFKLLSHSVDGQLRHGAEVDTGTALFSSPEEALAFLSYYRGTAGEDYLVLSPGSRAVLFEIQEVVIGGRAKIIRTLRYDGKLNFLGEEKYWDGETPRTEALPAPRFAVGDVVGTVDYGRYITGVVVAVYEPSDPMDDGVYLVDYGIGKHGVDHSHPSDSQLFSPANPPKWLLQYLARFLLSKEELEAATQRLRVR